MNPTRRTPLTRPLIRSLVATLVAAGLACGEGGPTAIGPLSTDGTGTVTRLGGTVSLGAEAGVIVPPEAVIDPVTITIAREATPPELLAAGAIGQSYRFSPAGQEFLAPVEIFVFVPDAALAGRDPNTLGLQTTPRDFALGAAASEALTGIRLETGQGGVMVRGATRHFSVISATAAFLPFADAGPDRSVPVGHAVQLIGVGSDPGGGTVTASWSLAAQPAGSAAVASPPGSDTITITPDVAGDYSLVLTVEASSGAVARDEVVLTATSGGSGTAPVADAGPDRTVPRDSLITLDGSGSSGAAPLAFAWRFVAFAGATPPRLDGRTTATPSFTPEFGGAYALELTVSDPGGSATDAVTIFANSPPVARLEAPGGVIFGESVTVIDASTDPDGDPLTRSWSLARPAGSQATLATTSGSAAFTTDVAGFYEVTITVSDGSLSTSAVARVAAVPAVAGTYTASFVVDAAPACGVEQAQTFGPGDLPISQDGDRVTFQLESISNGQSSDATGPITPEGSFDFTAPMRFVIDGTTYNASPRWTGRFEPNGDLDARFSVNAVICTITGSVAGTRQ